MEVRLRRGFIKDCKNLPPDVEKRLARVIRVLKEAKDLRDVFERLDVRKLKGYPSGTYRIRIGNWRLIIYVEGKTVWLETFMPRGKVY